VELGEYVEQMPPLLRLKLVFGASKTETELQLANALLRRAPGLESFHVHGAGKLRHLQDALHQLQRLSSLSTQGCAPMLNRDGGLTGICESHSSSRRRLSAASMDFVARRLPLDAPAHTGQRERWCAGRDQSPAGAHDPAAWPSTLQAGVERWRPSPSSGERAWTDYWFAPESAPPGGGRDQPSLGSRRACCSPSPAAHSQGCLSTRDGPRVGWH
jgi:hypothetical protein